MRLGVRTGMVLAGTGAAFPSDLGVGAVLTNADVYRTMMGAEADAMLAARGWRPEHPRDHWGVERREWIRRSPTGPEREAADVSDLAVRAADRALDDAGLRADDVDLLLAATSTPARITSTLASAIGRRLGVTAPCIDVRAGGAGGLDAWLTAVRFVSHECHVALVVAAETPSLYLDPDDLGAALLYGDGAAALLLRHDPDAHAGLLGAVLGHTDATGRAFTVPGSLPPKADELDRGRYRFQRPDAAYRGALADAWTGLCKELRESFPAVVEAIDHLVPYAVTAPQVRDVAAALGVAPERTFETLARHGCLGCPGPLVGLDMLRRAGGAHPGQVVALVAVAGGVSTAGMLWRL